MHADYRVFTEGIAASGVLRAGDALEPVAMATTVRVRGGEVVVTDGPFAETKEQLGGYYVIECADLDAAIEIAHAFPARSTVRSRSARSGAFRKTAGVEDAATTVERMFREQSGLVLAGLIRTLHDFDLAEEAFQDALVVALEHWPVHGAPDNPAAWITTTARRKAIDRLRREAHRDEKHQAAQALLDGRGLDGRDLEAGGEGEDETMPIADERLRLVFTCCHPALETPAQVALTLRTLGWAHHRRGGACLPRSRGDDGAAARARQAQDPARGHPVSPPVPRRATAARLHAVLRW